MEIWKNIKGYEELYQVSDQGRVKSLPRNGFHGGILKSVLINNGYLHISLSKRNTIKNYSIHRLVLKHFVGICKEGFVACHNNGNKQDNRLSNLRWDTCSNNEKDKLKHGTDLRGEKHHQTKLTNKEVLLIKGLLKSKKYTQRYLSKIFKVSPSCICHIKKGNAWAWCR